jgi:hypothetical protein
VSSELVDMETRSRPSACLVCGERPRTRVITFGPKLRGKPRVRHERQAALCTECLAVAAARAGRKPPTTTTLIALEEVAA